jgi:hypothetical protein
MHPADQIDVELLAKLQIKVKDMIFTDSAKSLTSFITAERPPCLTDKGNPAV